MKYYGGVLIIYKNDTSIKEKFVSSINDGLYETQIKYSGSNKLVTNAMHFEKMDNIANNVIDSFVTNPGYEIIIFPRGGYKVFLLYDKNKKVLYSFMSSSKFRELMDRKDFSHVHYYDALITLNSQLPIDRKQLALFKNTQGNNIHIINNIKEDLVEIIGNEPEKYISIVIDMAGLQLLGVEAVLTSEYLEVAYREDWSEFIEVDYNTYSYSEELKNEDDSDLDITLKTNVTRTDDISLEDITPKVNKKANNDN
ncbi:MAG: DUF5986 family protein [bacterium]